MTTKRIDVNAKQIIPGKFKINTENIDGPKMILNDNIYIDERTGEQYSK